MPRGRKPKAPKEMPPESFQPVDGAPPFAVGDIVVGESKNSKGIMAGYVTRVHPDGRLELRVGVRRVDGVSYLTLSEDETYANMVTKVG